MSSQIKRITQWVAITSSVKWVVLHVIFFLYINPFGNSWIITYYNVNCEKGNVLEGSVQFWILIEHEIIYYLMEIIV